MQQETCKLNKEDLDFLSTAINRLLSDNYICHEDARTVLGVLERKSFLKFLETENFDEVFSLVSELRSSEKMDTSLEVFETLRKLCMGVWLENCSSFAMSDRGDLLITVDNKKVQFSDEFNKHLKNKKDGITSTFYRQASLRQIERFFLMEANGLFDEEFKPQRIADIGSGTLIASVMLRERLPAAEIIAFEPGLVSQKTRDIAKIKKITLHEDIFEASENVHKFDLIMLHFVLEHDIKQSKALIKNALKMLSPAGKISIGVPNFDAFHRTYELEKGLSSRNPETRLSVHDSLSGHQIIFTATQLLEMISTVQKDEGRIFKTKAQSILPRPLSFNQILKSTKSNDILHKLEVEGHPQGLEDQGSVLAITIGQDSRYQTPRSPHLPESKGTAFQLMMI